MQITQSNPTVDIPSGAELIARARAMIPALRERAAIGDAQCSLAEETIADMEAAGLIAPLNI